MSRNLRKFVNPAFTRTVPLEPMKRLLERHRDQLSTFDFTVFDGDPSQAREAVQAYLAGPEDSYPEGLVGDLHRIAELGNEAGLALLIEQARRNGVDLVTSRMRGRPEQQEPKHVALTVFLDHPDVFNAASDMLAFRHTACTEYVGLEEGIEAQIDDKTRTAFEDAAKAIFERSLLGCFCRVGWYDEEGDLNLVVTYGRAYETTQVIEGGAINALCYRAAAHAALSYSTADGRLKVRGLPKARRSDLADAFATRVLGRPGFFAAPLAQHLYTLKPLERLWPDVRFRYAYDPTILHVEVIEAQVDRLALDLFGEYTGVEWSFIARDRRESALVRLRVACPDIEFRSGAWRLSHITMRISIVTGAPKPARVTVKLKPTGQALFKRERFEGQIMEFLRRNGFCCDQDADRTPLAAE